MPSVPQVYNLYGAKIYERKQVIALKQAKDYYPNAVTACLFYLSYSKYLITTAWYGEPKLVWEPKLGLREITYYLYAVQSCVPFPPAVLDWECPKLEEHTRCKNSTLLDTSTAVAIEKVPQFSNLSAILGKFSHSLFLM